MRANGKEKGGQDRGKWHISASNIRTLLIRTMRLKCHTYYDSILLIRDTSATLTMDVTCHHLETTTRNYDKGDQSSGGETTWTYTGATRSGRGRHKTG